MDEGKLWSLIRNILSQGGAIQLDRAPMSGYEEYSARLDAAASDRVADFAKLADARIAELEQSVTVRDTEIARLETDLELARRDSARMRDGLEAVYQYGSDTLVGPTVEPDDRKWHRTGVLEMTRRARRTLDGLPAIEALAGNGGEV